MHRGLSRREDKSEWKPPKARPLTSRVDAEFGRESRRSEGSEHCNSDKAGEKGEN